jgi:hypothetical protein
MCVIKYTAYRWNFPLLLFALLPWGAITVSLQGPIAVAFAGAGFYIAFERKDQKSGSMDVTTMNSRTELLAASKVSIGSKIDSQGSSLHVFCDCRQHSERLGKARLTTMRLVQQYWNSQQLLPAHFIHCYGSQLALMIWRKTAPSCLSTLCIVTST